MNRSHRKLPMLDWAPVQRGLLAERALTQAAAAAAFFFFFFHPWQHARIFSISASEIGIIDLPVSWVSGVDKEIRL